MANFNRDYRPGNNRNFGKPRLNGNRPDMHKATCADCGKTCEVPFRPTGSKPVYCKECFKNKGGSDFRRSDNRTFDRADSGDRQMYDAVCSNCGDNCQVPFQPGQGREVFCSNCFENVQRSESQRAEHRTFDKPRFKRDEPNYKAQFEILNAKMDKILKLLTPTVVEVAPLESTIDEKVIEESAQEVLEEKTETKPPAIKKSPKNKKASSTKKK